MEKINLTKEQLVNLIRNARDISDFELQIEYDSNIENWVNVQLELSNSFKLESDYSESNQFEKI